MTFRNLRLRGPAHLGRKQKSICQCITAPFKPENGSSLIELALLGPLLLLLLTGTVDMGRAFYAAIEVSSAASAGALYGTLNPKDTTGMQNAAVLAGANLKGLSAVGSYGCGCSDGSSASPPRSSTPSCTYNSVSYVLVNTSLTYTPLFKYPGVPSSLTLTGSSRMRANH